MDQSKQGSGRPSRVADPDPVSRGAHGVEEYLLALLEATADIITVLSPDGTVRYQNAAIQQALGYEPGELIGRSVFELVHPEDLERAGDALQRCVLTGARTALEARMRHKDGSWRYSHCVGSNLLEHAAVAGIVVSSRDVTEQKSLERRLAQAERLTSIGRLASHVAHDFNNVLMGIQPLAQVIGRRVAADKELARLVDLILTSVERGRIITHDLLRFTRPPDLRLREEAVDDLLDALAAAIRPQLPDGIEIRMVKPGEPLTVRVDREQLLQALVNLAANARDAMAHSVTPVLEIRARAKETGDSPRQQKVVISISDCGTGIPPEDVPFIFEPLFSTKRGMGLGLAVTHQAVTRHGGQITVETESGKGSRFDVELALLPERREEEPSAGDSRGEGAASKGRRVLLVEDDAAVAAGLAMVLEGNELATRIVPLGADAVLAIEEFHPDAVILDVGLPDIDGRAVFDSIAARWPTLPVLFSTAQASPADIGGRLSRPNVGFLQKPYTAEALLQRLEAVWREFDL